VLKNVRR